MKKLIITVAVVSAFLGQAKEPVDYVNTEIGNISHMLVPVFPAIQQPNGMLRVTPPNESFTTDRINGFYLNVPSHRQGQVFMMMPFSGKSDDLRPGWSSRYDQSDARPYSYSVFLDDFDTVVKLAPGRKAAIWSVTFENNKPRFLMFRPKAKGSMKVEGSTLTGTDDYNGMTVYLYMSFETTPLRAGAFEGDHADFTKSEIKDSNKSVVLEFADGVDTVRLRYGISYISVEQARRNLESELDDYDLDKLSKQARKVWNDTLGKIRVNGDSEDDKTVFYTALYRSYERMVNISEDGSYYSAWDGKVHSDEGIPFWTDDWSWDTYHALHPLQVILQPEEQNEKLTSYIRAAEQSGWMPTFPTVFGDAHCMNGNHAVSLFLDAWEKGVRGFDLEKAYECMKKTMKEESIIPWYRGHSTELDRFYWDKGYFPALKPGEKETVKEVKPGEKRQAVAVTLAASYDNWCMACIAKELGRSDDAKYFMDRSYDYRNLWKKETGFFHPKDQDGKWIEPFDYKYSGGQGARDYYDENNAWTYIWEVYHNIDDLINLFGSRRAFIDKLDHLFVEGYNRPRWEFYNVLPDSSGNVGMFVMGNEPSFHIPYLYNYAGEPWKTQKRIRMLMEAWFRNDLMGICGDEDGGGMSAFLVFSAMGFYPVTAGMPSYTFGSSLFNKVSIALANGKTFTLEAKGADARNKYIQSVEINGKEWNRTWFTHDVITDGGKIKIIMGDRPNKNWGIAVESAPPSQGRKQGN